MKFWKALTRKRRHNSGNDKRQDDCRPGHGLGHGAGQHVNATPQRSAHAQSRQVEHVQRPFQFRLSRFGRVILERLLPAQCSIHRVSLPDSDGSVGESGRKTFFLKKTKNVFFCNTFVTRLDWGKGFIAETQ